MFSSIVLDMIRQKLFDPLDLVLIGTVQNKVLLMHHIEVDLIFS